MKNKKWIAVAISSLLSVYYINIQDFVEVNMIIATVWAVVNLALTYRIVVSISKKVKNLEEEKVNIKIKNSSNAKKKKSKNSKKKKSKRK